MTLPNNSDGPQAGIPSWARVGAKVVCIDDWCRLRRVKWGQLTKGETYVIAGASVEPEFGPFLAIAGTYAADGSVGRWRVGRFRPPVTLEDDITTYFAELLDVPAGQKVEA